MTFEHDPALPAAPEADGLGGPARVVVHVCRHRDCPRPWLIWVDGAGQGGTEDLLLTHAEAVRRVAGPTCASIGVLHVGDGRITEVFNCGAQMRALPYCGWTSNQSGRSNTTSSTARMS